jgi:tetratricopeptide (TPR) repeat protein
MFMENKPQEALSYLEAAVTEDPAHVKAFIYLGIAYQQLNRLDDAIAVYQRILPRSGAETARIAFNLGNVYFAKGSHSQAVQSYTRALEADPMYATAFLNRANAEIHQGLLKEAVFDYERYLAMEPASPQRGQIEKLIAFVRAEFAAEEQRRQIAEETARLEAERRQRLMDEVSASLQAAAEGSKGLSAGNEGIQGYEGEFVLE